MIENATLVSIASIASVAATGEATFAAAVADGRRVCCDTPTRAQVISLGGRMADATAVVYVPIGGGVRVLARQRLLVQLDGGLAAVTYEVVSVVDRVHAGQSHYEAFCRVMP